MSPRLSRPAFTLLFVLSALCATQQAAYAQASAEGESLLSNIFITSVTSDGSLKTDLFLDSSVSVKLIVENGKTPPCTLGAPPSKVFVQAILDEIDARGQASDATCAGSGSATDPMALSFHFHREVDSDTEHLKMRPLLAPADLPAASDDASSLDLGPARDVVSTFTIKIPTGWSARLPADVHTSAAGVTFDQTFTFDNQILTVKRHLQIRAGTISGPQLKTYSAWLDEQSPDEPALLQLLSSSNPSLPGPDVVPFPKPDVAKLIGDAFFALRDKNLDRTQQLLDEARAADPEALYLWSIYGSLAEARGNDDLAMKDYEKELTLHPQLLITLGALGEVQMRLGRSQEAVANYQRWMAGDPKSFLPVIALMDFYQKTHRPDLAASLGLTALATLPKDEQESHFFQFQLAQAQLAAGDVAAGGPRMADFISHTTDPDSINSGAYYLAEQGARLDAAESAEKAVIDKLVEQSPEWTAYNSDDSQEKDSLRLNSYWDTLGLIYLREGKLNQAESLLRAAWLEHPDLTIGLHLGQALAAKDQKSAALDSCLLALATDPPSSGKEPDPGSDRSKLLREIQALEASGAKPTIKDVPGALQHIRSFDLGPVAGMRGAGQYRVALSPSGVEAVPLGSTGPAGRPERIQKLKLPEGYFPEGFNGKLIRTAELKCAATCTLTPATALPAP